MRKGEGRGNVEYGILNMKKNIYIGIGILILLGGGFWWSTRTEEPLDTRIPVSATFYPVAFLAEQIGGDLAVVKTIVPPGTEPHDFDPPIRDIADIYRSKLFLVSGAGVDRWAEKLRGEFVRKGVSVIVLSDSVDLIAATEDEEGGAVPIGTLDPHFWLDPVEYGKAATAVFQAFTAIDPAHAPVYRANFDRLMRNLNSIDADMRALSDVSCQQQTVVVSHNAFSYLSHRYGFQLRSLAGIDPAEEVSAGTLSDTVRFMREKHIKYVLGEPLGNSEIADTIGKEVPAEVLTLNPLEGLFPSELSAGKNYLSVMGDNWITLRKALECGGGE